jgi:hypothetical protein
VRTPERPRLVTKLVIVQLLIGGLLLTCGTFDLVSTVAGSSAATVTIRGQETTRIYDTRGEMEKQTPGYHSILVGGGIVGILLQVAMIVGAVGLFWLRAWGWWVSLAWAVLRLLYQVGTIGYLWSVAMPAANRMVLTVPHDDNGVCSSLVNGNTFYHFFWLLFSVGFSIYTMVILACLVMPSVRRAFGGRATVVMSATHSLAHPPRR